MWWKADNSKGKDVKQDLAEAKSFLKPDALHKAENMFGTAFQVGSHVSPWWGGIRETLANVSWDESWQPPSIPGHRQGYVIDFNTLTCRSSSPNGTALFILSLRSSDFVPHS